MSDENTIVIEKTLFGEKRPWGTYLNLYDGEDCKVKRIVVNPGENPSYQMHHKRSEIWSVISGTGIVRLEDEMREVQPGDIIQVPALAKHTIINTSDEPLVFIKIQIGSYFGEDDIVRFEDKYGRASDS